MASVRDWLSVIRVGNCTIISVATVTGYFLGGESLLEHLLMLITSVFFISAAGNMLNDYFDKDIDAVNKPWRPIPSGRIEAKKVYILALTFYLIGFLLSFLVSITCAIVALLAIILLYLYDWRLKRTGIPGNIVIAFLSALNIIYGSLPTPKPENSLLPAIYAFLIILGREVMKGIEDIKGDKKAGIKTIASTYGSSVALKVSMVILLTVIAISPIPIFMGFNLHYILFAFLGVDVPIIIALLHVKDNPEEKAWKATRILKLPLFFGLLAFLLGGL